MAKFEGAGSLTVDGDDQRIYDIEFTNGSGSQALNASGATDLRVEACDFAGGGEAIRGANSHRARITDCRFSTTGTIVIEIIGDDMLIEGCHYTGVTATYFAQDLDTYAHCRIVACHIGPAYVDMGAGTQWSIADSDLGGSILADGGENGSITGCKVYDPAPAISNSAFIEIDNFSHLAIVGNMFDNVGTNCIELDTCDEVTITANSVGEGADIGILLTSCQDIAVNGNTIEWAGEHGIQLSGTSRSAIQSNVIFGSSQNSTNTYDNINVTGNSDRNLIFANHLIPATTTPTTRYGISIGTATADDNVVVGNNFGGTASYGSGALNDAGTNTQTAFTGGPIGNNFAF